MMLRIYCAFTYRQLCFIGNSTAAGHVDLKDDASSRIGEGVYSGGGQRSEKGPDTPPMTSSTFSSSFCAQLVLSSVAFRS